MAKSLHCSIWKLRGTFKSQFPHLRGEEKLIITATIIATIYGAPAQSPTRAKQFGKAGLLFAQSREVGIIILVF